MNIQAKAFFERIEAQGVETHNLRTIGVQLGEVTRSLYRNELQDALNTLRELETSLLAATEDVMTAIDREDGNRRDNARKALARYFDPNDYPSTL